MLKFNVRNQSISRVDNFRPAEKSIKYLLAQFDFKTEDWKETVKTAVFRNTKTGKPYDAILDGNMCVVPWEVLSDSGVFEVSVYGVKDDGGRITTDIDVVNLNSTIYGGSATQDPSPTVYETLVLGIDKLETKIEKIEDEIENFEPSQPGGTGGNITVDSELSTESENPVQNKVVSQKFGELDKDIEELSRKVEEGNVTSESIVTALGYTPANQEDVSRLSEKIDDYINNHKQICTFLDAYVAWCNNEEFPIAFYGDSTFDGFATTSRDYAFSARLQKLLRDECGSKATVYNLGFSGQSLPFALENFETYFGEAGNYASVKMVGIGFGINDRGHYSTYQDYKNGVYEKYETLIRKFFARGIQPFLVTSQATVECGVATNYVQNYPLRDSNSINICANGVKKELAEKYGIPLIDLNKATESFLINSTVQAIDIISDTLHFGDIGHNFEAGYLFSQLVPRTIIYKGKNEQVLSYANQNLRSAVPSNKLSFGGDFKVYADYNKEDITDTKIFDAYVFITDYPTELKAFKNDGGATYVKVNGIEYELSSNNTSICTLDLGLHHLEVFTGASTVVNFNGFILNGTRENTGGDTGGDVNEGTLLINTMDASGESRSMSCNGGEAPMTMIFNHNLINKTTDLSNTTLNSISLVFAQGGTITIGKVDLNEFGSGNISVINPIRHSVTEGECNIYLGDLVVGENETICFGGEGDTAVIEYLGAMTSDLPRSQFATSDAFKSGAISRIGLKCKAYGRRNYSEQPIANTSLLVDTTNIGGNDNAFLVGGVSDVIPFVLLFNHDNDTKTTLLSGKKLASISFDVESHAHITVGKINLNEFGNANATVTPCVKKTVSSGSIMDLDGLVIGEHETMCIGFEGDNGVIYYTNGLSNYDDCKFTTYSGFTSGNPSNFALKCKIYEVVE